MFHLIARHAPRNARADVLSGLTVALALVPMTWETLWIVLPYAFVFAGVGLIESLLTLQLVDEITETRGQPNRECVALGAANITTGFFGGMGAAPWWARA